MKKAPIEFIVLAAVVCFALSIYGAMAMVGATGTLNFDGVIQVLVGALAGGYGVHKLK